MAHDAGKDDKSIIVQALEIDKTVSEICKDSTLNLKEFKLYQKHRISIPLKDNLNKINTLLNSLNTVDDHEQKSIKGEIYKLNKVIKEQATSVFTQIKNTSATPVSREQATPGISL